MGQLPQLNSDLLPKLNASNFRQPDSVECHEQAYAADYKIENKHKLEEA